jgi:hypothetical protein
MPTETVARPTRQAGLDTASRRILRLALGTALALLFSEAVAWPLSFIAPVFTLLILSLPLPVPSLKGGLLFVAVLMGSVLGAQLLLPFLQHAPMAGVLLLALALFGTFYFTALGGSALIGTFMTVGLTLVATIGSVNVDAMSELTKALARGAMFGVAFVWVAHALLPDPPAPRRGPPPRPPAPDRAEAARNALRALAIVLPVTLVLLFSSASTAFVPLMLKVATMGQQATLDHSRAMGRSLLESTFWGGIGAVIGWMVLSIWPSLVMYTLLVALAGLIYGPRILQGEGMHPKGAMWQYAFITMIVILAPTVGSLASGTGAGEKFWTRMLQFFAIAAYGTAAVAVFDAFWPGKSKR